MTRTKFASWEDLFENKSSFQEYNNKLEAIGQAFAQTLDDHVAMWRFLSDNAGIVLLTKNASKPSDFFLLHHCGTAGGSVMGDKQHAVAVTSFTADTNLASVLTQPIAERIDRRIPSS